jgi:flagellar export protein FliJ
MPFRFSLETVLRLRRSLEDGERLRLQSLLAERAQLETAIHQTSASRSNIGHELTASIRQRSLVAAEIRFAGQRLVACDKQSARLHASLATLSQHIERQQAMLLRRRIDRKVLEQLRMQQLKMHEAEAQRRQQSQMEELFLLRRPLTTDY